jgi:hypothetical protein
MQAKSKAFYAIWRPDRRTGLRAEGIPRRRVPCAPGRGDDATAPGADKAREDP